MVKNKEVLEKMRTEELESEMGKERIEKVENKEVGIRENEKEEIKVREIVEKKEVGKRILIADTNVRARKTPSLRGAVLEIIIKGTKVEVLETKEEWIKTDKGWSMKEFFVSE